MFIIFINFKFQILENFHIQFRQQLKGAVDLRCITHGSLETSRSKFKPESGEIEFSLRVEDPEWQPKLGCNKWDPKVPK